MVTHGDHIRTGIQDLVALLGGHTHHSGILTINDDEIRPGLSL